jgi:hypothetical protein
LQSPIGIIVAVRGSSFFTITLHDLCVFQRMQPKTIAISGSIGRR